MSICFITVHAQIWQLSTATTPTVDLYRSGNLGLGTITAPTAKLHIGSNTTSNGPTGGVSYTPHLILENNATNPPLTGTTNYKWSMLGGSALNFQLSQNSGTYASIFSLSNTQAQLYKKLTMVNADINIPNGTLMVGTTAATGFTANNVGQVTSGNILVRNGSTLSIGSAFGVNASGQVTSGNIQVTNGSTLSVGNTFSVNATGVASVTGINTATSASDRLAITAGTGGYMELYKQNTTAGSGDIALVGRSTTGVAGSGDIKFWNYDGTDWRTLMSMNYNATDNVGQTEIMGELIVKNNTGENEFKVYSDGKVRARKIKVDVDIIPDYVFDPEYNLMLLEDLKMYITENRHLPNVPSAKEYEERGEIDLAELNLKLLEKTEELTLYILKQQEEINSMKAAIVDLKNVKQ